MKTLKFLQFSFATLLGAMTLSVNAATLNLADSVGYTSANGSGTISSILNINSYINGASSGFAFEGASPNVVDDAHLQSAFGAKGLNFDISDFTTFNINGRDSRGSVYSAPEDSVFNGFMFKVANLTVVGLFDSAITSVAFNTAGIGNNNANGSNFAYFNASQISAVPIPAALWLFAPALIGFLGFRRRLSK